MTHRDGLRTFGDVGRYYPRRGARLRASRIGAVIIRGMGAYALKRRDFAGNDIRQHHVYGAMRLGCSWHFLLDKQYFHMTNGRLRFFEKLPRIGGAPRTVCE